MSADKDGHRNAAEEVLAEFEEAETRPYGRPDGVHGHGEAGDATSPNVEAQESAEGEDPDVLDGEEEKGKDKGK
ncbi:hypothetical protein [Streptomyces tsukubensis]|nr:hypothetical protein [Streptomyces tsukubensis]QFR92372.1 hypothetical protein GBW32_04020 [Streptomyces tsukubensis]